MRIAFDYQIFSLQTCGGISRYITRLAQELSSMQQEVKIVAPLHCNEHLSSLPASLCDGRRVSEKASKALRFALPYNHWVCQREIAAWRPKLVHETYFSAFSTRPPHTPTVVTVYDMVHERFPDQFPRFKLLSACKRKAVERADHVICISESTRKDLHNMMDVSADKVSVVHLGFDHFADAQYAPPPGTSIRRPYLLFVGQRAGYKNFATFLRAVSLSRSLKSEFDIIAFGGGPFSNEERNLIQSFDFGELQVRQASGNDSDLGAWYKNAAALVYPSLYEGFGLPPLEAMSHGCPVVVSNSSSLPEVVADAGHYFDPTSAPDMSLAIEQVALSEETSQQLIAKGKEHLKHFSWGACASATLEIYRKLT